MQQSETVRVERSDAKSTHEWPLVGVRHFDSGFRIDVAELPT
jgi:hypothetical protein